MTFTPTKKALSNTFSNYAAAAIVYGGIGLVAAGFLGYSTAKMGLNPFMTSPENTIKSAEKAGYRSVEVKGYGWLDCGWGESAEMWRTRFTAKDAAGHDIEGTMCEGLIKSPTPRF